MNNTISVVASESSANGVSSTGAADMLTTTDTLANAFTAALMIICRYRRIDTVDSHYNYVSSCQK
jgi:hypothetical protein